MMAYSSVFEDMFESMNDKRDPAILLKGISHNNLTSILNFMYQGSVDIPKSVLNDFITDAEELQVKGLRDENDDDYRSEKERNDFLVVSLLCSNNKRGSVTLRAHKLILAAYSSVFKDIFKSMNDKKDLAIVLKGISHYNLASVLDFMYQGSVDIPESVFNDFIAAAEELQIKGSRGKL